MSATRGDERLGAPRAQGGGPIEAPVRRVTLLEDRAQVRREATIVLPAGPSRLVVRGVAPVLADRTLLARAGPGLRVDEVKVERRWRIGAAARPPDARALLEEYRAQAASLARARALHDLLQADLATSLTTIGTVLEAVNRELPFAAGFDARWTDDVAAALEDARRRGDEVHASRTAIDEIHARLLAILATASAEWRVDFDLEAELAVDVTAERDGEHTLALEYVVPCAMWRPMHRATLTGGDVRFACEAAVWQATGEDWVDVQLAVSTARPTLRAEPPRLEEERLRVRKKGDKKVVVEVREETIATTGEGAAVATTQELQGVDDGGETRVVQAAARATVRANGRLRRVPLFAFTVPAELERVARPERSPLVHLASRQSNTTPHALLAGPVELVRDSGYVGVSEIGFVAPGERFLLGWGGDEALRVARRAFETREVGRLTGKQTITRTVELFVSNLADAPATFRLEERILVSEIDAVEVELDTKETRPVSAADAQGIVGWSLALAPHGTQHVKLVHKISASSDVVF